MQRQYGASAATGASGDPPADALDVHDLLESMGAHFHEHHAAIMRWPWKLFCRKWARLIDWAADEEERRERERMEQAFREMRAHPPMPGGGGGGPGMMAEGGSLGTS